MKEKVVYITEHTKAVIEANCEDVYKKVIDEQSVTLPELLGEDKLIKETDVEMERLVLDMSAPAGKEHTTDAENVKRVYGSMMALTDAQASDPRVWMAYTFFQQVDYMRYRWKVTDPKKVLNRYGYGYGHFAMRSLFRNGMSRLWWMGRITYDKDRANPYELTEFICSNLDIVDDFWSRTLFNHPQTAKAVLNAMFDAQKRGVAMERPLIRDISKYCNLLAGTYALEILDSTEIYDKITKEIDRWVAAKTAV